MSLTPKIDNSSEYYSTDYANIYRFISYFYQVKLVQDFHRQNVLEIGVGNKTTSNYLKVHGIHVTTCDIDENLGPDYVSDIRKLPFESGSFDGVLVFEVLEHLPWCDLDCILSELNRVTKEYVFISIPYFSFSISIAAKIPSVRTLLNLVIRVPAPLPFFKIKNPDEHCWEIGRKGYPLKKFKNLIKTRFDIIDQFSPPLVPSHCFFVLRKKCNKNAMIFANQ